MIKRLFNLIALLVIIISCNRNKEASIIVSIAHAPSHICYLKQYIVADTIYLKNGIGEKILNIDKPALYYLINGKNKIQLYIKPGSKISISYDAENFKNSVEVSGVDIDETKYLITYEKFAKENNIDFNSIANYDSARFIAAADSLLLLKRGFLNHYHQNKGKLNKRFRKLVEMSYSFDHSLWLYYYFNYVNDFDLPTSYFHPPKISFGNKENLLIPSYLELAGLLYDVEGEKILEDDSISNDEISQLQAVIRAIENSEVNRKIKEYFIFTKIYDFLNLYGVNKFDSISDYIESNFDNPDYFTKIDRLYSKKALIAPGRTAPDFTCYDNESNIVKLADIKGKYIYITFWASWCSSCREELPYFIELCNSYKNNNIAFVSISLDKDETEWKNTIKELNIPGIKLFAVHGFDSEVALNYQVNFIPTFVLIDKDGKIINYQAPDPSSNELKDLLNKLLE